MDLGYWPPNEVGVESDRAPAAQCGDPSWGNESTRFLISDNASDKSEAEIVRNAEEEEEEDLLA